MKEIEMFITSKIQIDLGLVLEYRVHLCIYLQLYYVYSLVIETCNLKVILLG